MSTHRERHDAQCVYKALSARQRDIIYGLREQLGQRSVEENLDQLDTLLANIAADFEALLEANDLGCGTSLRSHPVLEVEGADQSLAKLHGIVAGLRHTATPRTATLRHAIYAAMGFEANHTWLCENCNFVSQDDGVAEMHARVPLPDARSLLARART